MAFCTSSIVLSSVLFGFHNSDPYDIIGTLIHLVSLT